MARRRIMGQLHKGQKLSEPSANASALIYGGTGSGKTTSVTMPTIMSLLPDRGLAIAINDVKGEIAPQIADMCVKQGRKFGVVDDLHVLGEDYPYRVSLNPFGAAIAASKHNPGQLPLVIESNAQALIEQPSDDKKNTYWYESPQQLLGIGQSILLYRSPNLCTPGGLYEFMADPIAWEGALKREAEDPESPHRAACQRWLDMRDYNPEHYSQHMMAALTALRIFSYDRLRDVGKNPDLTHEELLRDNWIVCFVSPLSMSDRLGPYFALNFLALTHAQLSGRVGRSCFILDEFCQAPLREAVNRVTVFRAFGLRCLYITQSRQDAFRKYGEKEIATLEENCQVIQYLSFSNFEEAERVSKAIGDQTNISPSLGLGSDRKSLSMNFNTGKDRRFTPWQLMSLPPSEQIIRVTGVGFIHCLKVRQNELAPYCHELAPNPLEGGVLPPDPKIYINTGEEE